MNSELAESDLRRCMDAGDPCGETPAFMALNACNDKEEKRNVSN
ncbi:hypothetical protein [Burkholderia ubonensis]|nr:hypothetical protein [Burkholderia ubonensis]